MHEAQQKSTDIPVRGHIEVYLRIPGTDNLSLDGVAWVLNKSRRSAEDFVKKHGLEPVRVCGDDRYFEYDDVLAALSAPSPKAKRK